jgi:hypothetical protein
MTTIRVCMAGLACGLALAGCATTRTQTSVPAAPMRANDAPEERQPEGWPPYYPPRLVRDLAGTDAVTGEAASIERGYVLHRIDLEKVRVLDARAARCDQDLGVCEQRVASLAAPSGFWDSVGGRVLLIGLGFLAGMSATAGIAIVVE